MEKDNFDKELFRDRLQKRLDKLHLKHSDLADKVDGVSKDAVDKWCGGSSDNVPSLNRLYKVSKALGVSLDYFVNPDMNCLTMNNQMISNETGLSDNAINGLKEIKKHDAESSDENKMAKMITKSDEDFHSIMRQRMNIINFILSHPDILEKYLDAFIKCAVPFDFTIPVIKTNEGKWERFSPINNPIALASSEDNLLSNMEIDIVGSFHAIAKNELNIIQDDMLAEYRKTIPNYDKKAWKALLKAYSNPRRDKSK